MKSNQPPRISILLIQLLCKSSFQEEILGDLEEFYLKQQQKKGKFKKLKYWYHTITFLRIYALKTPFKNSTIMTMFKLNLIVAYRNLVRNKFYAFINIFGLGLSLATCLLILVYIIDEQSFDKHWEDSERIYRIAADLKFNDTEFNFPVTPAPMADAFREEFPELTQIARMRNVEDWIIRIGDNHFTQSQLAFTDPEMLEIFNFQVISGKLDRVFEAPNQAMLSEEGSKTLFGTVESIGKTFSIGDDDYEVKAVYKDFPKNTHFHYTMLLSMENLDDAKSTMWLSNNFRTYLKLNETNNQAAFESKLPSALKKYFGPQIQQVAGVSVDDFLNGGGRLRYYLQPVESIHLESDLQYEIEANGNKQFIYIFMTAGLFILVIAVVNFMNISTARASNRAKEVGLRKVIGSQRNGLVWQFLIESTLNTFLAMILAIAILYLALPAFNNFTLKAIENPLFGYMQLWDEVVISVFVIGFLAGVYPAFYLSAFQPVKVLKGHLSLGMRGAALRNILVVTQFTASVILIFGSVVIYSQLRYTMKKSLGFDKEQVLVINDTFLMGQSIEAFREELLKIPSVENVSISGFLPVTGNRSDSPLTPRENNTTEDAVSFQNWLVDEYYIETLKLNILEGRDFNPDLASDSAAIIINQEAAKQLGLEDPVGKKIRTISPFTVYGRTEFKIIGVIENFHFDNIKNKITPLSLIRGSSNGAMAVRFGTNDVRGVISTIEDKWKEFNPTLPFNYAFMDHQFESLYDADRRLGTLFNFFASLAIIIACLGLYGLASFTADQRKKELGIRKVLGASTVTLMKLQIVGYTKLLIIAVFISLPCAFYITRLWLDSFAYRTEYNILMFIIPVLMVFILAWVTVSSISYVASKKNPVENLNYE